MPSWTADVSLAQAVVTVAWLGGIVVLLWKGGPVVRKIGRMAAVVLGAPAEGDMPAVPGLGSRTARIETALFGTVGTAEDPPKPGLVTTVTTLAATVERILDAVPGITESSRAAASSSADAAFHSQPNHGSSAYDKLREDLLNELAATRNDIETVVRTVATHTQALSFLDTPEAEAAGVTTA